MESNESNLVPPDESISMDSTVFAALVSQGGVSAEDVARIKNAAINAEDDQHRPFFFNAHGNKTFIRA